jgi:hypothetical protein
LLVQRLIFLFAVVGHAGDVVHRLMQGAAQGHVHFLKAAADRQQRYAAFDGGAYEGQRGGVARRVLRQRWIEHGFAIQTGIHIGRRAGEHDAVGDGQQRFKIGGSTERRDDQWRAARTFTDGGHVLELRRVIRMCANVVDARGNQNDRATHGRFLRLGFN